MLTAAENAVETAEQVCNYFRACTEPYYQSILVCLQVLDLCSFADQFSDGVRLNEVQAPTSNATVK